MRILVLVKEVPDTWEERNLDLDTGRIDRGSDALVLDEINERALEVALRHQDTQKETDVVVVSMGPASVKATLRKALSLGASSAVHLIDEDLAGADLVRTAAALSVVIRDIGFDLVIAGEKSTDGNAGVIPAMVAEYLGVPHLTSLNSVEIGGDAITGERATETGTATVSAPLPAVISVTEMLPEARFASFKGIMTAKRKTVREVSLRDFPGPGTEELDDLGRTVVLKTTRRPARASGTKIVDDGNAVAELTDFLVAERLI